MLCPGFRSVGSSLACSVAFPRCGLIAPHFLPAPIPSVPISLQRGLSAFGEVQSETRGVWGYCLTLRTGIARELMTLVLLRPAPSSCNIRNAEAEHWVALRLSSSVARWAIWPPAARCGVQLQQLSTFAAGGYHDL